ncbi:MAG: sulfite oxidase [Pirellulales bacterium]|nr:sulfite oxidase [Pirellulales bacterium]
MHNHDSSDPRQRFRNWQGAPLGRRRFLHRVCALASAAAAPRWIDGGTLWGAEPTVVARCDATPDSAELIRGKAAGLIVHNARPLEIETPLEQLRAHAVTPADLLFVRNNLHMPEGDTLEPLPLAGWTIDVAGLVEFPRTLEAARLAAMPTVEHEIVLQCSGNGRKFYSATAEVKGSPWTTGAMGNVRFRGVPLRAVLEALDCRPHPGAKFLTAEGRDVPISSEKADFEHSIPLDDALDRSLLAIELNGAPIPAVHGGPVRLVTPGYYATMNVKWLSRLRLEGQETPNHNQVPRYRTPREPIAPGSAYVNTLENSEPNWNMRTKSVIFAPLEGEQLPAGEVEVRGVAFNDGRARIEAVEISIDGGQNWRRAELAKRAGPYAWQHWSCRLALAAGEQRILARAIDALGRSQPLEAAAGWNPDGYAYNGVHRVTVQVVAT